MAAKPKVVAEFKECESCAAKSGTPTLCEGCLHNRRLINAMKIALEPFADFAEVRRRAPEGLVVTQGSPLAKRQLVMGDMYRARDALEGKTVHRDRDRAAEIGGYR